MRRELNTMIAPSINYLKQATDWLTYRKGSQDVMSFATTKSARYLRCS
jgi:hypothetical protein